MTLRTIAALALCIAASPTLAFAAAETYRGTIGDQAVVVEFSTEAAPGNLDIFGRYFYADQGIDIPLHAVPAARTRIGLVEEVPCSEDRNNCPRAQDDPPAEPPLGARWELSLSADRKILDGEFELDGRTQPVHLEFFGSRTFDASAGMASFADFATGLFYQGTTLTALTSPYDYLKVTSVDLILSSPIESNGATYRYVADPRTKFQFPRIVELNGTDATSANAALEQRHWMMNLDALYCVAQQYQGFGWDAYNSDAGTLGWWDEEAIDVQYLSPTIMSWTESGSLSCGYAHPDNHHEFHNLDVGSGQPLDLSRIFADWVARSFDGKPVDLDVARANPTEFYWGPGEALSAFVKAHRPSDEELGFASDEEDCRIDELIDTNLAISVKGTDTVLFALGGLPYAIQACGSDLYEAPIGELVDLLAPDAAVYFPSLRFTP